ncbi:unnamed protein product [Closterium sp. Naga37s-1]|nr:unnamed protein product [Closterium sp. Naga37s-1]
MHFLRVVPQGTLCVVWWKEGLADGSLDVPEWAPAYALFHYSLAPLLPCSFTRPSFCAPISSHQPVAALTRRSLDQTTLSLSNVPVAALTRRSLDQTTLSLSNVVGPLEEVALHGHPISAIIPSVVGSNHVSVPHL